MLSLQIQYAAIFFRIGRMAKENAGLGYVRFAGLETPKCQSLINVDVEGSNIIVDQIQQLII